MTEILLKYHGIDWIAIIMTFLTLYYLGERRRFGFVFGIVASISWLIFGILVDSIANIIANVIFIALNLRGYLNWKEQN
ncbi:MAG: nicotinamide mononucleotide transporter [Deltaproteobacteria bacterium]|nr:nicotinamide mononucleotide transporter [Deltaproteobacteria bacterium]